MKQESYKPDWDSINAALGREPREHIPREHIRALGSDQHQATAYQHAPTGEYTRSRLDEIRDEAREARWELTVRVLGPLALALAFILIGSVVVGVFNG